MLKIAAACCLVALFFCCRPGRQMGATPGARTDLFMEDLLAGQPDFFREILAHRQELNIQVIYTQIDRKAHNKPVFTPHYFNVDARRYFYPASMVKMPIALLSLEKLHALNLAGVDKNSPMITGAAFSGQTMVLNDPTAVDGVPSVAQYIKKIFLVSDNDAHNRLYEFLGQEEINKKLAEKGYLGTNIYHRLSLPLTMEENRHTNPVRFTDSTAKTLYEQPEVVSKEHYVKRADSVGKAYLQAGKLVNRPLDFSNKNRFSLEDMTKALRAILFPQTLQASERFNISDEDYRFVRKYMSEFPGESISPEYSRPEYWDTYCKFLYYGSDPKAEMNPAGLRVFNKVGDAYGFLTDVAYFADFDNGIEFMLSATIYCNSDGVLNDDKYDYDTVGYPFMKQLGQLVYSYEKNRKRKFKPDLSEFRMDYDKR